MLDGAFGWIGDVARWFGDLIPRWDLLQVDEGGVKHKPGGRVVALKPGRLYCWWPAVTRVETIPTAEQSVKLPPQHLTTKDGRPIVVRWTITYVIDDVVQAVVRTSDFDQTIKDVAAGASTQSVLDRKWTEFRAEVESKELLNEVARRIRTALRKYGVYVKRAYVSDLVAPRVHAIITDGDSGVLPLDE